MKKRKRIVIGNDVFEFRPRARITEMPVKGRGPLKKPFVMERIQRDITGFVKGHGDKPKEPKS